MMFLDCPAWPDEDGARQCGLPAEVRYRFTMRSSDGPIETAMIRCPSGHRFNGPIESLTWEKHPEPALRSNRDVNGRTRATSKK